jgi:hypothetical protein
MRFSTKQHKMYCGIDRHARTMYLCILSQHGESMVHQHFTASPDAFLQVLAPYRDDSVVAVECLFTWYWLADLGAPEGIPCVLGHALYMKAMHGGRPKTTRSMRKTWPYCCVGACSRRPTSPPLRGGPLAIACDVACLSCANAPGCWPTSSIPTAHPPSLLLAKSSPTKRIGTASRSGAPLRRSRRAWRSTSPSSATVTSE